MTGSGQDPLTVMVAQVPYFPEDNGIDRQIPVGASNV